MSLLVATQITAVATAILALFAIVTAVFAFLAFRKQSAEVATLQQQFDDQRKVNEKQTGVLELQARDLNHSLQDRHRDLAQRHWAQAVQVFILIIDAAKAGLLVDLIAEVRNSSQQPVYDLVVHWYLESGPLGISPPRPYLVPGGTAPLRQSRDASDDLSNLAVALEFRDAAHPHWRTTDRGELTEICGATGPKPNRARCRLKLAHEDLHSWENLPTGERARQ